jgi:hypothetical protein
MINQSQTLRALLPGDALTGGGIDGGNKAALAETSQETTQVFTPWLQVLTNL